MTKLEGRCLIDSIELVELSINPLSANPNVKAKQAVAKYALANKETGTLYGSGTFFDWSDDVKKKIHELLKMMELEIGSQVFELTEIHTPSSGVEDETPTPADDVPGL